ncbi:hypothetical protein BZL29_8220 [Mycobacterium kansasii]|uniref:Uncharacterized protein n=1 Tax=Mycobacterium kansasii TaxID=1768 RepID=A0A1V3WBM2_MYCKA|nr:hypothetical protein BZL29_8220 [Mycobacterium kansasii]
MNLLAELLPPLSHKPRVRERVVSMFQSRLNAASERLEKLLSDHGGDTAAMLRSGRAAAQ